MIDPALYDQVRDGIAKSEFTAQIQTKIALVLSAAKSGNLMFQSNLQWVPNLGLVQQFLLSQSVREMEAITLLRTTVRWSADPRLLPQAMGIVAPLLMAWGKILLPPGPLFSALSAYRGISLGHAQLAGIRLAPIIPDNAAPLDPFVVALRRIEQEDARMLQTQIRLLKSTGSQLPLEEREALIDRDRELVAGVVSQFLSWLADSGT